MKVLTVGVLREAIKNYPDSKIVYLGDDEELNNIHQAFFVQSINREFASSVSYGNYNKGGLLIS